MKNWISLVLIMFEIIIISIILYYWLLWLINYKHNTINNENKKDIIIINNDTITPINKLTLSSKKTPLFKVETTTNYNINKDENEEDSLSKPITLKGNDNSGIIIFSVIIIIGIIMAAIYYIRRRSSSSGYQRLPTVYGFDNPAYAY